MVIVRRASLNHVLLTRSYHSPDYDSNRSQVCCKIKLLPKKLHRSKHIGKPRIDTTKMQHPEKLEPEEDQRAGPRREHTTFHHHRQLQT